jgi:hypothetical protein
MDFLCAATEIANGNDMIFLCVHNKHSQKTTNKYSNGNLYHLYNENWCVKCAIDGNI